MARISNSRIWKSKFKDRDVTDEGLYLNRRQIMAGAAGLGLGSIAGPALAAPEGLEPNPLEDITNYNNYYEFGTGKGDPAANAAALPYWRLITLSANSLRSERRESQSKYRRRQVVRPIFPG